MKGPASRGGSVSRLLGEGVHDLACATLMTPRGHVQTPQAGAGPAPASFAANPFAMLWWRRALPACCFLLGAAAMALVLPGRHQGTAIAAQPPTTIDPAFEARVTALEARLQAFNALPPELTQVSRTDRFLAAALYLQAAIASPRPWLREYELMASLAPAGILARPLGEVLASHAGRGVPTEGELRERFTALMPLIVERAPHELDVAQRTAAWMRGNFAAIGLAAPPSQTGTEAALAAIADQLRRGNLAAAAADAATLHDLVQPLLAGWLAQARARLAVEQAIRETLLLALSAGGRPA